MKPEKMELDELYQQEKFTPSVLKNIRIKEDLSGYQPRYCGICPATKKSPQPVVPSVGNGEDVLVVLPHWNIDESRYGRVQLTGREREATLRRAILTLFQPMQVSFTHAYGCRQDDYKIPTRVITHCSSYLEKSLEQNPPKVILACGPNSQKALGVSGDRGAIVRRGKIPVVITMDPRILFMVRQNSSGQTWGPDYYVLLKKDVDKVLWLLEGNELPTLEEALEGARKKIKFCRTLKQVEGVVDKLWKHKEVVVDIETTSLDPWADNAKVLMIQVGPGDGSWAAVIPLWHREFHKYDPRDAMNILAPLLLDEGIVKIGHNIKFDTLYLWVVLNLRMRPVEDTQLFMHSLHSGIQKEYSLKTATRDHLWETGLGGYEEHLKF